MSNTQQTIATKGYAAFDKQSDLKHFDFHRRPIGDFDIHIEIEYSGVCHSDLHLAKGDWGDVPYPLVPGHEIVGRVKNVGSKVSKHKIGNLVGVGCLVDSCQSCHACDENLEQYCLNGSTMTYGSADKHLGGITQGGYSKDIVVDEKFVLSVSEKLDIKAVAPLLCAGITTYSPLNKANIKKGDKVAIAGFGGLGHMGIKFAKAMGAEVTVITTSEAKGNDAKKIGADYILLSRNQEDMAESAGKFDYILNTIPVSHDINPYVSLLKYNGTMVLVGVLANIPDVNGAGIIAKGKTVKGSLIGGIKETQEMLDFCALHNIVCDVEMIDMEYINEAYKRLVKSDVKYRFVIDMKKHGQ